MNELEWIRKMAARAAGSHPPAVDPTAGVLAEIARRRRTSIRWVGVVAAAASVAAVVLAVLALQGLDNLSDPMTDWFALSDMVLQ